MEQGNASSKEARTRRGCVKAARPASSLGPLCCRTIRANKDRASGPARSIFQGSSEAAKKSVRFKARRSRRPEAVGVR
jgi:hypothetical protein